MKVDIAIIGAGFSGLAAAIKIKSNTKKSFQIFERAASIGGTWRDNIYPGCACDIPSVLYSFSFDLNPKWTRIYPKQEEILSYLQDVCLKYELDQNIKYNCEINSARFDSFLGKWNLYDKKENLICQAKMIIAATGPLNKIKYPNISGLESFKGHYWHSSKWNTDIDLSEKRVAVIGTGASAIQLIPSIADKVKKLYVFQRTPPWVIHKPDRALSEVEHFLHRWVPGLQRLRRWLVYLKHEVQVGNFLGNSVLQWIAHFRGKFHLKNQVPNENLRKILTPAYEIGCKRVLLSNNYFPALQKENVELIIDTIQSIDNTGINFGPNKHIDVDAIIYCTGFNVADLFEEVEFYGTNGKELNNVWANNDTRTLLGISVHNYPNLLFLAGPNTGLGHNSIIFMIEAQLNYILQYIQELDKKKVKYFDLKEESQDDFHVWIQEKMKSTVWESGCNSWYRTAEGKNNTIWPSTTIDYYRRTKKVNLNDYQAVS